MSGSPSVSSPLALTTADEVSINEGVGVVVRVRPLSTKERADARVHNCIHCMQDCIVIDGGAHARSSMHANAAVPASQPTRATTRPYQFSVDQVFNTHASQIEVYEQSCKRIVEGVFHGVNGSILAYGATGSGKTHTMFGSTMSAAGIVYQAVQDIFAEKERLEEEEGKRVRIKCSFLEVYNEDVFDLLAKPIGEGSSSAKPLVNGGSGVSAREAKRVPLQVREASGMTTSTPAGVDADENDSSNGGLHIHGLTHIFPETLEDFARSIEHGHAQRFVAVTGANSQSSRSHAIITVEVEVRNDNTCVSVSGRGCASATADEADAAEATAECSPSKRVAKRKKKSVAPTVTIAKIQFADLAGSERAASTSNVGLRLREGGNINRSLLALGAVVQSLAQQKVRRRQTGGKGGGKIFIPYRGSKLTRLLRDSIGGNCRTLMLFCLSPSTKHTEETVNTMKFAMNAREIQVEAHRNEFAVNSSQLAKTQEALIEELREELARMQSALAVYTGGTGDNGMYNGCSEASVSQRAGAALGGESDAKGSESPSPAQLTRQASSPTTSSSPTALLSTRDRGRSSPAPTPAAPGVPPSGSKSAQQSTATPSAAAVGRTASPSSVNASRSSVSFSVADTSRGGSVPRSSLNCRTARPSVFAENTPLFSELEAKLKNFSAHKESLYHEVREAQERQRDRETQLREQQWRLATFLVSDISGSRARGEVDGNCTTAVGVAGLRKMIAAIEAEKAQQADQLAALTEQLDDADRQFAATRQDLLRERQGTSLELLLDNTRLRQGCTEAECLAAHYHQECRSLLNRQAEYAEALSKCVEAIQRLRPYFTQLASLMPAGHGSSSGNAVAAAVEAANVALLYALLPTASTAQMAAVFESALRSAVKSPLPAPALAPACALSPSPPQTLSFVHPPLAPSPTKRSGRSCSRSPLRGGGPAGIRSSNHLAEHFRDLMATAELMHLTSSSEREASENTEVVRTRHGHLILPTAENSVGPEQPLSTQLAGRINEASGRAPSFSSNGTSHAYGRTVSLTGLTQSTTTVPAGGRKGRAGQLTEKRSSSGLTSGHMARTANGDAGATAKRKWSGGATNVHALQRSVSAPLPFSRMAPRTTGTAAGPPRRPKPAGSSRSAAAPLARRNAGGQRATGNRALKKMPVSSFGYGQSDAASPSAFARSSTDSPLQSSALATDSAGYSLRGRLRHRSVVSSSSPALPRASSEATANSGSSRSMPSSSGAAKKQGRSRTTGNKFTTVNVTSAGTSVGHGQPRAGPCREKKRSGGGAAAYLLARARTSSSNLHRGNSKVGKLDRPQATSTPASSSLMAGAAGSPLQRQPDGSGAASMSLNGTGTLSRISSSSSNSSSLNVSCVSEQVRFSGALDSQAATAETGAGDAQKVTNGERNSHESTPQLTVARLLECAAAATPALPQYNDSCSPKTHNSDYANKENSQHLMQLRTRTGFTDDLMVSLSTSLSDALSPNSRGQISSTYY
ncbi:hypothetical protein LSCM1_06593 [Leishmania martiniquensis]|uniref:Kinesin motor domain-containing protein n=1 Tax=Leishmania martiniquensis TaxID=1580590 RepID=A0A836HII2_9TRYP|nr:hypothetical protein LSCM1_06593 [Leishmania martiniquensis]